MKKTSYVILALIGAWLLLGTIVLVLIAANGHPRDNDDNPGTADMTGPKTTLEIDPFDKVEFHSTVYLYTNDDYDDDDTFRGVEIRKSDSYAVEYAESWGDGFTYEINDGTLSITLNNPEGMKSWRVTGDPIIVRLPDIKGISTSESVDISVHDFNIPSLAASVTALNLHGCHIGRFEYVADATSTIWLKDSTMIDTADITLDASVTLTSSQASRCGAINARSRLGLSELRLFDFDYAVINVENTEYKKVEIYSTQPYSVTPVKPE